MVSVSSLVIIIIFKVKDVKKKRLKKLHYLSAPTHHTGFPQRACSSCLTLASLYGASLGNSSPSHVSQFHCGNSPHFHSLCYEWQQVGANLQWRAASTSLTHHTHHNGFRIARTILCITRRLQEEKTSTQFDQTRIEHVVASRKGVKHENDYTCIPSCNRFKYTLWCMLLPNESQRLILSFFIISSIYHTCTCLGLHFNKKLNMHIVLKKFCFIH